MSQQKQVEEAEMFCFTEENQKKLLKLPLVMQMNE